jgi:hypothetical protein
MKKHCNDNRRLSSNPSRYPAACGGVLHFLGNPGQHTLVIYGMLVLVSDVSHQGAVSGLPHLEAGQVFLRSAGSSFVAPVYSLFTSALYFSPATQLGAIDA